MRYIGYTLVSSRGQSLEDQLDKLNHCEKVFQEIRCGTTDKRPNLKVCLENLREGDTLVVTRLDRLARSTLHLCQIADFLEQKKINVQVTDQNIDTNTASGRFLFNILGAIFQFETEIRAERQSDGIIKAKKHGIKFGPRKKLTTKQVKELHKKRANGILIKTLMKEYQISKVSVYRYLSRNTV